VHSLKKKSNIWIYIGKGEIRMDPEKVKAILEWPTQRSVPDIRSFVGSTSQLRRFIKIMRR